MHMNVGESMVISNAPREWALERAIRNLAPDVIVTDEIYSPHEIDAIKRAIGSGIKVIATMHADKMEHVPEFFDTYVALGSEIGAMKVIRHD